MVQKRCTHVESTAAMSIQYRDLPPVVGLTTERSRSSLALTVLFYVLAVLWVGLRVYARRLKRISFTLDDHMVFAALVCPCAFSLNAVMAETRF